jgi:hypothetical protein
MSEQVKGTKVIFQAALLGALVALVCAVLMGFVIQPPVSIDSLQPSLPSGPVSEFMRPINDYPELTLRFFAADSLFVLSYLMLFVGLYVAVRHRSPHYARVGLGAGVLAAILDAMENAYFITYALLALNGVRLTVPALPLIYVVANLKWMAVFATFYAFGLVWPREDWLGWAITVVMLLLPLVGVLGVAWPDWEALGGRLDLEMLRGVVFLPGLALVACHFWRELKWV